MSSSQLKVDWCSFDAAKYAVEHWHYSKSMPAGKTVKVGVWEHSKFIGCVIFSYGAQQHLGKMFGLTMFECPELTRIALNKHETPVTRIVSIAIKMLKRQCPGVRMIISYADCDEGHHGGIYAGGNWIYIGKVQTGGGTPKYKIRGEIIHGRTVHSRYGRGSQNLSWLRANVDPKTELVYTAGKHKYAMPLDDAMKRAAEYHRQPNPKREHSTAVSAPGPQPGEGGSSPTCSLL